MIIEHTDNQELICPACGEAYLHQEKVEITFRDEEDGDGVFVRTSKHGQKIARIGTKEIPGRRDFLEIYFHCEKCDKEPRLQFMQVKGTTVTEWIF